MTCTLKATKAGKFAPLIGIRDNDMDIESIITTYNAEVTDAAIEILGKERRKKRPWITRDVLDLCDKKTDGICRDEPYVIMKNHF